MPPRSVTAGIVLFWAAMSVWLFRRDVWPRLAPGEPPPLRPLLSDTRSAQSPTTWTVRHHPAGGGRVTVYTLTTHSVFDEDSDTYELHALLTPKRAGPDGLRAYGLHKLHSVYRVTQDGRMLGFEAEVGLAPGLTLLEVRSATFRAEVRGRTCTLDWEKGTGRQPSRGSEEFGVPLNGVVLLPLHPVSRVPGLYPGRHWGQRLFDPLTSAAPAAAPRATWVNAEVRDAPETLRWNNSDTECLVIDYEGDHAAGSVWVDAETREVRRLRFRLGQDWWDVTRN